MSTTTNSTNNNTTNSVCNDPKCWPNCPGCNNSTVKSSNWWIVMIILILAVILLIFLFIMWYGYHGKSKEAAEPKSVIVNKHVHSDLPAPSMPAPRLATSSVVAPVPLVSSSAMSPRLFVSQTPSMVQYV